MNNSELAVSQTYRSRFLTQLPKVNIGTSAASLPLPTT